jgi:hypothetical protein
MIEYIRVYAAEKLSFSISDLGETSALVLKMCSIKEPKL